MQRGFADGGRKGRQVRAVHILTSMCNLNQKKYCESADRKKRPVEAVVLQLQQFLHSGNEMNQLTEEFQNEVHFKQRGVSFCRFYICVFIHDRDEFEFRQLQCG